MKICLNQYQRYYNSVKEDLKINHTCLAIMKTARSIESNMKYLCHYNFIHVTSFYFLGDGIIEKVNFRLKRGDVTVSKNMSINTLVMTQIQMSKTQARKIKSTYCVIYLTIMV